MARIFARSMSCAFPAFFSSFSLCLNILLCRIRLPLFSSLLYLTSFSKCDDDFSAFVAYKQTHTKPIRSDYILPVRLLSAIGGACHRHR